MEAFGATAASPQDLVTRAAVHDLVVGFYREIVHDDLLGPVFDEVAEVDWAEHIPVLIDYWSRILVDEDGPSHPIVAAHRHLHAKEPLRAAHCDRWWHLWCESLDSGWVGPGAERAKDHAASLMRGMAKHVFGFDWSPSEPAVRAL